MTYVQKLKDPRWQKKRLEVLSRDNFTCQHCGKSELPICVHHLALVRDSEIWDLSTDYFVSLCENCHLLEQDYVRHFYEQVRDIRLAFRTIKPAIDALNNEIWSVK